MEKTLKPGLDRLGYRCLHTTKGPEVWCKFGHVGEEFSAIKLYREIEPSKIEYYTVYLYLPKKTWAGQIEVLNAQKFRTFLDRPPEWMDIGAYCEIAERARFEDVLEKVKPELDAKLLDGER